eukprot:4437966-Prymnesium_polylepis.1
MGWRVSQRVGEDPARLTCRSLDGLRKCILVQPYVCTLTEATEFGTSDRCAPFVGCEHAGESPTPARESVGPLRQLL